MILKGSQRGSGQNLAAHLMRSDENEHVRLHDIRGFASSNLKDAFKEVEAISLGTNCRQYLFSLSLSPPADQRVEVGAFEDAIGRIEGKLGLDGQPRAIVFHEKEGRRHAHCVWSRIDAESMTAKPLPFFKQKLMGVARELYLEHGWKMPRGFENAAERNPLNFTLAEWQQAKRQEIDPRWVKSTLQSCWGNSDSARAFCRSVKERGFVLARGDRRGFVALDHRGDVWSLSRMLDVKAKALRERLGDGADLPDLTQAQGIIGKRMTPALRRHVEQSRTKFSEASQALAREKDEMTKAHRSARTDQQDRQSAEWQAETKMRAERVPKGLLGLWHRITGKYQDIRRTNETEAAQTKQRHEREQQELIDTQTAERRPLQERFQTLRHDQAKALSTLREDIGRFTKFSRAAASPGRENDVGLGLER